MRIPVCGAIAAALILSACSNGEGGTSLDHSDRIPIPCFSDDGPLLCHINDVPVPVKSFERFKQFYRNREPLWTDRQVQLNTLEKILIPKAVTYDLAKDRLDSVSRKSWEIYDMLIAGDDFAEVAQQYTEETGFKDKGGLLGTFRVESKELTTRGAEFLYRMWNQPVLIPTTPFIEYYGIVILVVTEERNKGQEALWERTIRVIVRSFFNQGELEKMSLRAAFNRARVSRIQDPEFEKLVPKVWLKPG